jgi:hypothetical protein
MSRLRRFVLRLLHVVRPGGRSQTSRERWRPISRSSKTTFSGLTPEDARLAARRAFGGVEQTKERHRDAGSFGWLDDVRRDLQYSLRTLRRTPGFTAGVVLTLSLGIGVNTAIFTLADALLLRRLAVHDPTRLIAIAASEAQGRPGKLLAPMLDLIRDEHLFAGVCGFSTPSVIVEIHGRTAPVPQQIGGETVYLLATDCPITAPWVVLAVSGYT